MQRITSWLLLTLFTVVSTEAALGTPTLLFASEPTQARESAPSFIAQAQTNTTGTAKPASQITNTVRTQSSPAQETLVNTQTLSLTNAVPITALLKLTTTIGATSTRPISPANPPPTSSVLITSSQPAGVGPLEGTIIANRTETTIRFFVEGKTYELIGLRSQGINLPRGTAVLNLFNCDAKLPETQAGCYWDPYLLNQNGFYEIVTGADAGKAVNFTLREAGSPPVDQIWVQNRTGEEAMIFYNNEEFTLAPGAVEELVGEEKVPLTLYLRSCLEVASRTVCEWYPQSADPGVFYALTAISTSGTVPNSRISALELQPVMATQAAASGPVAPADAGATPQPQATAQIVCNLQVPAINVRTGPGLEYEIVAKVRGTEAEPGTVLVVGRDSTGQWLAVTERVAPGGWITGNTDFVKCTGDITALPETEVTDGRLVATPTPAAAVDAQGATVNPQTAPEEAGAPAEATSAAPPPTIPDGQALLVINNGFDQMMRFTVDQRYRVEQGPSEFDLQPGQSMTLFVYPGQVAFTASTPWRGLADNADFFIENRETRTLYLTFVPDPDGSGNWLLQY